MPDPTDTPQDVSDMLRLKAGDDLALNALMARWKEPLIRFCFRYCGNGSDAVEIAQETFVKVYQSRARYQPTAAFSTWLFRIASNLCKMRARWKSRHPEVFAGELPQDGEQILDGTTAAGDPGALVDRRALAADLDRAIRQLPHDLRITFVLHAFENLSHREIGKTQGCSEKAVERRLARARLKLRELLEPYWSEKS